MNWNQAFEILEPLATDDYIGGAWPDIRYHKCRAFFHLAQQVKHGCIVELGTFRGLGAIALALGADVPVYTVDPYRDWSDAAGYRYYPADREILVQNLRAADISVHLHQRDHRELAREWIDPIGLLVWDLGVPTVRHDIELWLPHLCPDAIVATKETGAGDFGSERLSELGLHRLSNSDYDLGVVEAFGFQKNMTALWIVSDTERYQIEAQHSRDRVQQIMPELDCQIRTIPNRDDWFVEQCLELNQELAHRPDDQKILWLDSDVYLVEPAPELFEMLDRFDLLLAHAPGHHTAPTVDPIPNAFPEFNIGVVAMKNTPAVRDVWYEVYRRQINYHDVYGNNDQASLRETLWNNRTLRYAVLPSEYDCRFNFGCQVRDRVKILHGRTDNYEAIAQSINAGYAPGDAIAPRTWLP